jgi:hypothetical protein
MNRTALGCLLACGLLVSAAVPVQGQGKSGPSAPDFPPGTFTDNGNHKLSDFEGKVVVLYFFEPG